MTDKHTHDVTNETHRADCAECQALWAELDSISAEARQLPLLTPSRDLWSGIEARIGGGANAASDAPSAARLEAKRRWFQAPVLRYAAAAALLVGTTATITWQVATRGDAVSSASLPYVIRPDTTVDPNRIAALRNVSQVEDFRAMDGEIKALQELLAQRRAQLDSTTVAVLEKNLAVIDTAIAESRKALANDPASVFLAGQLTRSYTTKITLLRSTATMPVGL